MFSKEESKRLRQDFWTSFGKSYPKEWILYNTKIKGLTFRFHFNLKIAQVSIEIDHNDFDKRIELWDKLYALRAILKDEFLPEAIFNDSYEINEGKDISKIYVEKSNVSIHNKNTWQETMEFLYKHMNLVESFFEEYKDILS